MDQSALVRCGRLVEGLWDEARAPISVAWATRGVWRWRSDRRVLSIPASPAAVRARAPGQASRELTLTTLVGALLHASEGLLGEPGAQGRDRSALLGGWSEAPPLVSSLLLSSLELGVGERWARYARPGLGWSDPGAPPPPYGCEGWVSALWEASEALRGCGRGDIITYRGRLLLPLTPVWETHAASPFSARRYDALERAASARYEHVAWVVQSLSEALEALTEALEEQAELPLELLAEPFSSRCPLSEPTFLCEPRAYLSALDEALRFGEEEGRARREGEEGDEPSEEDEGEGEGLLPPMELERAIWEEVSPHLERVTSQLSLVEPPQRSARKRGLFESGRRVELRALMSAEASPERRPRVWQRSDHPQRTPQATLLLVDLSSSMRGPRLDALLEGLSLVCLALATLKVPFALLGFQDELIPLLSFEQEKPRALCELIPTLVSTHEEVWGVRRGGHNRPQYNDDGPCLEQAVAQLRATGAVRRSLWVLSDGLPKGARSGVTALQEVISRVQGEGDVALYALGLGPDTRHVERLYPVAQGDVPLERLAEVMGALLLQGQRSLP